MVATTPGPERDPHDPAASDPAPHARRLRGAAGVRGRAAAASAAASQRPARPAHRLRNGPTQAGPVGPPLKGSTRELLERKVLRGTYPPGYRPKRPTAVMPPQPQVANDIPALAAYLK